MYTNVTTYHNIVNTLTPQQVTLVAVSKTKPAAAITELYDLGQRHFGENYVQELVDKQEQLPSDVMWHFIGHLQSNKVKYIAPFIHLIHGVDSEKLLVEINKQAQKNNRIINCLLQMHIAKEETKFGLDAAELQEIVTKVKNNIYPNVNVTGLMAMASFTTKQAELQQEFILLQNTYTNLQTHYPNLTTLSSGMSSDYQLAIQYGSTMVRIGSLLFGSRV